MRLCHFFIFYFSFFIFHSGTAQLPAINNWREHLPYKQAMQVTNGSDKIWCGTVFSVFSIDKDENSIDRWTKVNGLSETGVNCIGWNETTSSLIIAYSNSNLDLLKAGTVSNINSIKNSSQSGDKTIYQVYCKNELAYLSSGIGIIVIDVSKNEIKDTYIIGSAGDKIKVNSVTSDNNYLYAATVEGLKKALLNTANLSDYRNWQSVSGTNGLPAGEIKTVVTVNNEVIACKQDSLFIQSGANWSFLYADGWSITDLSSAGTKLLISQTLNNNGRVILLNRSGIVEQTIQNNTFTRSPQQSIFVDNEYWIADSIGGLSKYNGANFQSYVPNSPSSIASGEMVVSNSIAWVAAGAVNANWQPMGNKNGLYQYANDTWKNVNSSLLPAMDSLPDCITVAVDRRDGTVWSGSMGGGLFSINSNNVIAVFKQNSPLQPAVFAPGSYRVSGLSFDTEYNLWISNYGAIQNLHARKVDGSWRSFNIPFPLVDNAAGPIVVDDLNQKWIIAPTDQGLVCFNHGATIDNPNDDRWKWYKAGKGNGNLPDNRVLCIVKDKNSFIWIGTKQGVGIIQCPQDVFTTQGCEALLPIVQQDNFAGYLFRDEEVQSIAVDGADRKWVGTKNGVWLISPDGEKTIYRFTSENSPLPDNDVKQIMIDGNTGETFFSTAKGIVAFRSTATEGGDKNNNVLVFPNPVPPGYSGTIAIRGLVNNAIVKITELDGRLVFQTRALGGQAIWNGKNYKGQNIAAGVYLVLVNDDGKQEKIATKIVFVKH